MKVKIIKMGSGGADSVKSRKYKPNGSTFKSLVQVSRYNFRYTRINVQNFVK